MQVAIKLGNHTCERLPTPAVKFHISRHLWQAEAAEAPSQAEKARLPSGRSISALCESCVVGCFGLDDRSLAPVGSEAEGFEGQKLKDSQFNVPKAS